MHNYIFFSVNSTENDFAHCGSMCDTPSYKYMLSLLSLLYDGPSVKEKIGLNLFSLPFIGERK